MSLMEVEVCANCGMIQMARDVITKEPACPICDGREFIFSTLPEELTCYHCKVTVKTKEILKTWKSPPFFNNKTGYYCGCHGWD